MAQETYQDYEEFYPQSNKKDPLYNWVFHYNAMTNLWNAIPRDHYNEYWDNTDSEFVIKSTQIDTLIDLILKISNNKLDLKDIK